MRGFRWGKTLSTDRVQRQVSKHMSSMQGLAGLPKAMQACQSRSAVLLVPQRPPRALRQGSTPRLRSVLVACSKVGRETFLRQGPWTFEEDLCKQASVEAQESRAALF